MNVKRWICPQLPRMGCWVLVGGLALRVGAEPPPKAAAEMDSLLAGLRASGCKFQRNGTWYDAPQAVEHLKKKRVWLERHDKIEATEDFIRLGASESSMSGKPYTVKCPDRPVVESRIWLGSQLARMRAEHP